VAWLAQQVRGIAVPERGSRRGAAGGLPPHHLVLIYGNLVGVFGGGVFGSGVFGSEQQSGVRHVDGLALQAGNV
jgi:hypothetical protein